MFSRYTDRARRLLVRAQEEAVALNHACVGTEHFLLALTRDEESVAVKVLTVADVSVDDVRNYVMAIIGEAPSEDAGRMPLPFSPQAKQVLEATGKESARLGHCYVGTEHLLLGLCREDEAVAGRVLADLRVDLERLRGKVIEVLHPGS